MMTNIAPTLPRRQHPKNVAFIGDYLPRQCGIATFTADMYQSYARFIPDAKAWVVSVNDTPEGYDYPDEVRYDFFQHDQEAYRKAAEFLNAKNVEVVCLQHEYGIYGGPAGNYILTLLRGLTMPIVSTFHTILKSPDQDQLLTLKAIADLSARVVCMSEKGRQFLTTIYEIPDEKIDVIAHGIPDMPFVDPHFYKDRFGLEGKQVLFTFGLLSPNKGIENVINALPRILEQFPNVMYMVLGATHPHLIRHEGEKYRDGLKQLAEANGVRSQVQFYNQFVELDDLLEFLGAADIYITPYLNPAQITSGTLAYSVGVGKAVISTPYWHAEELLADERGRLVPFGDAEAIADEVLNLLNDEPARHAMRKRAYLMGRGMTWETIISEYADSFAQARHERMTATHTPGLYPGGLGGGLHLPTLKLDHVYRLTDSTGMIQHARYHLPFYEEGYCTDDNARALILMLLLKETGLHNRRVDQLRDTYMAFINHAYSAEHRQFRNFMSYDRRWLEEVGSEDSTGRTIWALGMCIGRTDEPNHRVWAISLLEQILPTTLTMQSPRTWAFALLGIHEYLKRFSDDRLAKTIQQKLVEKLMFRSSETAAPDWPWFENTVSYDNGVLCHALLVSGNAEAVTVGLSTLTWLMELQTSKQTISSDNRTHFQPVGSNGFHNRGAVKAEFDQQPLEAYSSISACLTAWRVTGNVEWQRRAMRVFRWFTGLNDLGLPLYDSLTGGCRDGLHIDRVNQNQGAESTLSYLLSLAELQLAFQPPIEKSIARSVATTVKN